MRPPQSLCKAKAGPQQGVYASLDNLLKPLGLLMLRRLSLKYMLVELLVYHSGNA